MGLTNIELVSDRPLETNLKEMLEVKKLYPKHTIIASITADHKEDWQELVKRSIDAGADLLELNFSCPHGMCERGMGSAIGQDIKAISTLTSWVKECSSIPFIVKLTPNISDINVPAEAAVNAGADALALINTIKSIANLDLDTFIASPRVDKKFTSGGYSGPAVKPIALHMLAQLGENKKINVPISGIGGIENWKDAADFIALGSTSVQICTAVMHHGFKIVEGMIDGLNKYLDAKKMSSVNELIGAALPNYSSWGDLNLNYKVVASIDGSRCIGCQQCYTACLDGSHQCIHTTKFPCQAHHGLHDHTASVRLKQEPAQHEKNPDFEVFVPFIDEEECVGCNLCSLICPVNCISMKEITKQKPESWNERSKK
jgi:dihydropyrimidine dehydrogenase (NAD+) subunit PreA